MTKHIKPGRRKPQAPAARACAFAAAALAFCAGARAVPLENWRQPLQAIAAERGDGSSSSPSGLFWDDCGAGGVFDSSAWPDTAAYARSHLTLEPSAGVAVSNADFISGKPANAHGDLLCDIRLKNFSVRNALDVDGTYKSDPGFAWHKERIAAGRIEEAYCQYRRPHWFVRFGRMNRCWGPMPDRSLVLSNNPFSYEALEWQITAPVFEFRHLVAAFPRHGSDIDTRGVQVNRFFAAHSLKIIFGTWASLGITEAVVFARSGMPDLQYINPFSIYAVINTNQEAYSWGEGGGNLMLALDWRIHPFTEHVLAWGQVAFDDFQVDDASPLDKEPMHWGLDVGVSWKDFLRATPLAHHAALRYRYVSKWIYTVNPLNDVIGERYTYLGRSLGAGGIDGDELEGSATVIGRNFWAARLGCGIARQDTGTVATLWPLDSAGTLGYRREEPLSRRDYTETTLFARLAITGYFRDFATLELSVDNRFVRNLDNRLNDGFAYDPVIRCAMTPHYSDWFLFLDR